MWRKIAILTLTLGVLSVMAVDVAATQGNRWVAEFFNNQFLSGPAVATRVDGAVAFDWGLGSPASGVDANGWAGRWGTDVYFPAGTYRFWALADEGVKVNVGYAAAPQIDTFSQPAVGQLVSADITLTEGVHHIQVDYKESLGMSYLYFTWANLATNPQGPNFPKPQVSYTDITGGSWTAQYYDNPGLVGTPMLIRSESGPSNNWGSGAPAPSLPPDNFSVRWSSVLNLEAGAYTISVLADDGVRVYVNGVLVIDRWGLATNTTYTASFNLNAGASNFIVEYFESSGQAAIEFNLARQNPAPPVVSPTGVTATVNAGRLNVRAGPAVGNPILVKINRNESYAVIGVNTARTWWQINVNGVIGWVSGRFIQLQPVSNLNNIPVTG